MNNIYVHYKRAYPQHNNISNVEDAIIEEIYIETMDTGFVLINYERVGDNYTAHIDQLRLNVDASTVIQSPFGEKLSLNNLEKGMYVNAVFSAAMTRSIPPQAYAYQITLLPEEDFVYVRTDRVVNIDTRNRFLYTGNPNNPTDQMRFAISDATLILDRNGNRTRLEKIRPGQMVTVEHATFQTPSIPPQTTAFRIQLK